MQYTISELQELARVYMTETGISATALSQLIAGHDQVVRRLLAGGGATQAIAAERISDWFDANWPIHVPWPREIEQRGRARTARLDRYDEMLNEAARKLGRLEQRLQSLDSLANGFDETCVEITRLAGTLDERLLQFRRVVEDVRETLVRLRLTPSPARDAEVGTAEPLPA